MLNEKSYELVFKDYGDVVTIDEMMEMLKIKKKAAYSLINKKKIEAFKIGKEYKIPKINILLYLNITSEKIDCLHNN